MTFADFVAREQQRMRGRVLTALGEHYRRVFCSAPTFTLDSAAACAFFDPKDVPDRSTRRFARCSAPTKPSR